jgi:multidrug transporter EmrE-like cation transporter
MSSRFLLLSAIGFEVAGSTCMKLSLGFSRWMSGCFTRSGQASALAIVIIGMAVFGESMTSLKAFFIAPILVGVIGLKILSSSAG